MDAVSTGYRPTLIYIATAGVVAMLGMLPASVAAVASAIVIAVAGIPHGSLDLHLLSSTRQRVVELVLYLASIIAVLAVWFVAPRLMLGIFLVNSAWHFGDCDVQTSNRWRPVLALLYGLAVLLLLINPVDTSVDWIIAELLGGSFDVIETQKPNAVRTAAAVFVVLLPLIGAQRDRWPILLRGVTVVAVSLMVPSLLAFTWYFAVVHSWTSMDRLRSHVDPRAPRSWRWLLMAAAPLTLLTYAGIGLGALLLSQTAVLTLLFVALSALTVPHSRLFHRVYQPRPR